MKKPFRSLFLTFILLGVICLQTGCELPKMPWDKKVPAVQSEEGATDEETTSEEETASESTEETTDVSQHLPAEMRSLPYTEVTIPMADGLSIMGRLYDPAMTKDEDGETVTPADSDSEYTGPKYPLVILLHGLNFTQARWQSLPGILMKAGYAVFAMDLRGHGQSTRMKHGRPLNWRALPSTQWKILARDVGRVITYLGNSEDHPEVSTQQVALIGEKLGANVAAWATKQSDSIQALVLLTPGMSIKGLDAGLAVKDYSRSTLILVNQDEADAYSDAKYIYGWVQGPKVLQVYKKAGEGADMLTAQPGIAYAIRDWLVTTLPPARIPGAALSDTELQAAEKAGQQAQANKHGG